MRFSYRTRKILSSLISYALLYLALILCLGYVYGSGDLIEIQPYWDAFFHPEVWENDFFVSNQLDRIPNERFVFVWLLSLTGPPDPYIAFAGHFLTSILLFHGMRKLASIWVKNECWQVIAILLMTLGLYGINTGGNELYYPLFTNSYLAQAIGIWAIYFLIANKKWPMMIALIITSFIHILIGVQLFVLIIGAMIADALLKGDILPFMKKISLQVTAWILTAGVFFLMLFLQVREGTISTEAQFEIMEFRLAHHFFPAYFPARSWIIITLLTIGGLFFFMKRNQKVFLLIVLTISGGIVYTTGIYLLQSSLILSSQWFEATIWMEYFSVIALVALLARYSSGLIHLKTGFFTTAAFLSAVLILISLSPIPVFKSKILSEPLGDGNGYDENISRQVKLLDAGEVMFAIPPELTAFKWYAQKPSYVDYKAMIHHKEVMEKWYERVNFLYGIDISDRRSGINLYAKASKHLAQMLQNAPTKLRDAGISHVILPIENKTSLKPLISNEKYGVYVVE